MRWLASVTLVLALAAGQAAAQAAPAAGAEIALAPELKSAGPAQVETMWGQRIVRNVSQPSLTPFLPDPAKATGAAVIVAPGGAFLMLSIDSEGDDVARWLAAHGVAAFVLKYRLEPTPADHAAFQKQLLTLLTGVKPSPTAAPMAGEARAAEDGLLAMRYVRANAGRWGISPDRIGFMGFSAGGITAQGVTTRYDAASRPSFSGVIYGALQAPAAIPTDAPPLFIAAAADDPLVPAHGSEVLFDLWRARGKSAELHIYQAGGHGFGMRPQGLSSDHWIEQFYDWLQAERLLKPAR